MVQQRTFFRRFGCHGVCVLPDSVLSDDPLADPDMGKELPSLRDQVSLVNGVYHRAICYARIVRTCGDGLYWADVAATPDLANTQRVILTEEDLYFALPYDVRVQGKTTAQIRTMMAAHAREVRPAQRVEQDTPTIECVPAPVLLLEPLAVAEVGNDALQEAIGLVTRNRFRDTNQRRVSRSIGSVRLQQAFLRVIIDALMAQLTCSQQAHSSMHTSRIRTQCATVSFLQRWQRHSRQRIVNALPVWNDEQHAVVWQLTVGDPLAVLVA
jgi:hypothetical protein